MQPKVNKSNSLQPGFYYHIYNRGNNGENIFIEERNYPYFLQLYTKYIVPITETYAYCLLRNHFHLLVRIKEQDCQSSKDWQSLRPSKTTPSRAFSNLFSTYTKAINKSCQRSGSLFEKPFHQKIVQAVDERTKARSPKVFGQVFRSYPRYTRDQEFQFTSGWGGPIGAIRNATASVGPNEQKLLFHSIFVVYLSKSANAFAPATGA